ncbi:MAG: hypothetical protein J6P40_08975 [Oscillospiraceae bacterium]|nr:hypothetical protein [Oscillospiraceae bacterium]
MPRHKKTHEEEVQERKINQQPEADPNQRDVEWFHLPHCMDCGREIPLHMKNYTIKSATGRGTLVVCPICASKPGIRLKTPYISYDGLEAIRRLGGE